MKNIFNSSGSLCKSSLFIKKIISLLFAQVFFVSFGFSQGDTIRIMPLGNSLTAGIMCTNGDISGCVENDETHAIGYRLQLYDLLTAAGYYIDFVGSEDYGSLYLEDPDNAAFPAIRDHQLAEIMEEGASSSYSPTQFSPGPYLDSYHADVIMLHIGTNDVLANDTTNISDVERILDAVDAYEASSGRPVTVFLSKIISQQGYDCNTHPGTVSYNQRIDALASARIALGDNLVLLDLECGAGIDYTTDMIDQVHPNQTGYDKMGDGWFVPVEEFLSTLTAYSLTMQTPEGNGTVSPAIGSRKYVEGSVIEITATPGTGYSFTNWSGSVSSTSPSESLTMNEDKTVKATFTLNSYSLTVNTNGVAGASTTPTGTLTVNHGVSTAITATAPAGYNFTNWSVTSGSATIANINQASTTVTLTAGNATIQANFALITYNLTVNTNGIPGASTTPSGTVSVNHGVPRAITATAPAGYNFVNWTITSGTATIANPNQASTTVTLTTGNATIQANFTPVTYNLTVNTDGTAGASTTPTGTVSVNHGAPRAITATAPAGYTFVNWEITSGTASIANTNQASTTVTLTAGNATIQANFALITYTLTTNVTGTGTVTRNPDQASYASGTLVQLTANPGTGFNFVNWTGAVTSTSNPVNVTMNSDKTVTANFILKTYQLTVTTDGTTGSSTNPTGTLTVNYGVSTAIAATAPAGYSFVNWTTASGTASIANPNLASTTVTLTTENATIRANFTPITYSLTVNTDGTAGASVTPSGTQTVSYGTATAITATTPAGYNFVNWTAASGTATIANPNQASTTVTLTAGNATVRANFALITYNLTVNTDGTAGASTTPTGTVSVNHGVPRAITATAPAGYTFVNWTNTSGIAAIANPNQASTTVTLTTGNATVRANFTPITYSLTVTTDGTAGASTTPTGTVTVNYGAPRAIAATAPAGYNFVNWTVPSGDASFGNSNLASTTVTLTTGNATIRANFVPVTYNLRVTTDGTAGASTTPSGIVSVNHGAPTAIAAMAPAGYSFANWTVTSGTATIANNSLASTTVTLTSGNATVRAIFIINTYTITGTAGPNGSISPSGAVSVNHGEDQSFAINPVTGYEVDKVLVDAAEVSPLTSYTFSNVSDDHTISASFKIKTYTITATSGLNGSVSPTGTVLVNHGANRSFTITPATGYEVDDVLVDGTSAGPIVSYTFTNVTENHTIAATFKRKTYTITASAGLNGSINPGGTVLVQHNDDQSFSFIPETGYKVNEVLVDGVSQGALESYTFENVKEPHTISVSFVRKTYTIIATAGLNGTITPSGTVTVDHGADRSFIIEPATGYEVNTVLIDGISAGAITEYTFTDITANHTIAVTFKTKTFIITASAGTNGTINPSGEVTLNYGANRSFNFTPAAGYEIKDVLVDGVSVGPVLSYSFLNVTEDHTISVSFKLKTYIISAAAGPNGMISPAGEVIVDHGTDQSFIITPNIGYEVKDVLVDGISVGPILNYTFNNVISAHTISVSFIIKTYTITATAGPNGTITPSGEIEADHGTSLEFEITPRIGYAIDNVLVNGVSIGKPETYLFSNITKDNTIEARFKKVIEIKQVSIPDEPMKIDDVVPVTIVVTTDAGIPYSLVSGTIGGYALSDLTREDSTTYTASLTIIAGGNSYSASQNIPVANLVLTNGTINGTAYNGSISQANDPIDAIRPVINFIWVESGNKRVGQTVRLIINSNNLNCTVDPTSTVNGIPVGDPSIVFSEVGSGVYSIDYTVQEGDNDVGPGELKVSIVLVKPSGNKSVPFTTVNNSALLTIDANSPVITKMEVPSGEVGIGGVVEVTITADETGYIAGAGTVINEIPLSSSRVTFTELTGGKYLLSYIVAVGDKSVPTGGLKVTLYMLDGAGNITGPYTKLEPNSLSIYTELPTATLAGTQAICADEEAELTVYLTGRSPWSFYLSDGAGTKQYTDIYSSPYLFNVAPTQTSTYRIDLVSDANGSLNTGSGSAVVTVREKTPVEITNPITTFNVEGEPVQLLASLPGGTFSGPGVNSQTGIFDPAVADTINSPHTVLYTYVNSFGCTSIDSALFFVLGAEGDIFIPRSFYCNYQAPFTIVASNIAGATGSFTLLNEDDEEAEGLTDKGNNTATIDPGMLEDGNYTVEYAYLDDVMFYLRESFIIESAAKPDILAPESDEYCMNEPAISMLSSVAGAIFSGPGVSGNSMNGYVFDPGTANVGLNTIVLLNSSMSGCKNSDTLVVRIHPVPEFDFSVNNLCVSPNDTIYFNNTTPDKYLISSWNWNFGDPESVEENTSTDESPWHIYNKAGQRTIQLIGQTSLGCTDTLQRIIKFGDSPGGNFRWANECFDGEAVVSFTSEMTSSNEITGYTWTFTSSTGAAVTRSGGKTISHTFDALDNYTVLLRAESEIGCIGTSEKSIQLKPVLRPVASDEYLEDFSQGKGWWSAEEANSSDYLSWDFKVVNFANLNDELSRAWYTKLPSSPVLEESWVKSPCFDLNGLDRPMITLDIYRSLAKDTEGVVLQATNNGGLSWKNIGEEKSGINWYSSSRIDPGPGGQPVGWSGKVPFQADAGWTKSRHDLDAFLGESSVQFRVAFASEHNSGELNREGFAFDNVRISDRERKVLLEHFTNTSSNDTREVDGMLNGLYNWFYTDLVKLEYHTSYPGVDPFNAHNPSVPALRGLYYGVPSVPYSLLNGGYTNDLAFNYNPEPLEQTDLKSERLRDAMFSIDLQAVYESSRVTVSVSVTALQDLEPDERIVHIAIYEKLITGVSTVNGAENFLNVVKTMLPNAAGTAVFGGWVEGQTRSWQYNWDYANVYDPEMIRVAAFIQNDDTREVYQAETLDTTNLTTGIENEDLRKWEVLVYPNPATDLLNVLIRVPGDRDDYEIELFDQVGRMVLTEKIYQNEDLKQINLDALNKGIYYVRIRDDQQRVLFVNKVIIMN